MEAFIVALSSVWADSGFSALTSGHVIMICVGLVLLYMAIGKGFIILGLIGWGVQALGFIVSFLGEGITGCIGCFCKFFWIILVAFVLICLIF